MSVYHSIAHRDINLPIIYITLISLHRTKEAIQPPSAPPTPHSKSCATCTTQMASIAAPSRATSAQSQTRARQEELLPTTKRKTNHTTRTRTIATSTICTPNIPIMPMQLLRTSITKQRRKRMFRGTRWNWPRAGGPSASSVSPRLRRMVFAWDRWIRFRERMGGGIIWIVGGCLSKYSESTSLSRFTLYSVQCFFLLNC